MNSTGIYFTHKAIHLTRKTENKSAGPTYHERVIETLSRSRENNVARLKTSLRELNIYDDLIVIALPRAMAQVRYLTLPASDPEEIKRMVQYDLYNLFPFQPEEVIFDVSIIHTRDDGYSKVMVIAVRREIVEREIALFKETGVIPTALTISTMALCAQLYSQKREAKPFLLVYIEDGMIDLIAVCDKECVFNRGISFNEDDTNQEVLKDVQSTLTALDVRGIDIGTIVLGGKGAALEETAKLLGESCGRKAEIDNTLSVSGGLTRLTENHTLQTNLLPYIYREKITKGKRKKAVLYFAMLVLINVSLAANLVSLKIKQKQAYLRYLKTEIQKVEQPASFIQQKMLKLRVLNRYFTSGRGVLNIIAELYRLTPEGIVFTSLDMSKEAGTGTFIIIGQGPAREDVLRYAELLKSSPMCKSANVKILTERESASGTVVDFEIKAEY